MKAVGVARPSGSLRLSVVRTPKPGTGFFSHALPKRELAPEINAWRRRNLFRLTRQALKVWAATRIGRLFGITTAYGRLRFVVYRNGVPLDYGIASYRVVTDAGVAFIVDAMHAAATIANLKFHGFGTGTTNEAASQTALVTELTTEYATDNTRPTGTQTENGASVYETVATLDPDSAVAITEHGIFDQASNAGGTLLDRSKFSAINLAATGDTLAATYDFTITSGG